MAARIYEISLLVLKKFFPRSRAMYDINTNEIPNLFNSIVLLL